jgi:hypothetical protein
VVTVEVWGSAAALVIGSVLLGRALAILCGGLKLAAPALGLAVLIIIADIAIQLPGKVVTADVVLVMLVAGAAALVIRDTKPGWPAVAAPVAGVLSAVGAAIPFIANGRIGLLGVSLDNDTEAHLIYAEPLRSAVTKRIYGTPTAYPLGPHSLADAVSSGFGVRLDFAFTGLLVAIVIVTALVACQALRTEAAWKQVAVGVVAALFYLVSAYYAEGAFKETLLGLLLLAFVLHLEEVTGVGSAHERHRWRSLIPVPVLIAAGVYVYSYLAVGWFALTLALWVGAELVFRPARLRLLRVKAREFLIPVLAAAGLLLILLAPNIGRVINFFSSVGVSPSGSGAIPTANTGNLPSPLSPYEALGIWTTPDFRFLPGNLFHAGELGAFALGVLVLGLAWSMARRQFLLPAAVVGCAVIYWRASHGQSSYVSAKALVIAGPVVAVTGMRGLLGSVPIATGMWLQLSRLAAAMAFIVLALYSSYEALRNEPVWPAQSTDELLSLAKLTRGQTVLFLGSTDYAEWIFHDSSMSALSPTTNSLDQAVARPTKPANSGVAIDWDTVDPADLNRFNWLVTSNTGYASQAPAAFRLVRQLPMWEIWKRVGTALPRQVLEPPGAPGAILDCRARSGRLLSRQHGIAATMAPPVVPTLAATAVPGGATIRVGLGALQGRWQLSLQYTSAAQVEVTIGAVRRTVPAYLDRPGPWFAVGTFVSAGTPTVVTIKADRPSAIAGPSLNALIYGVAATPVPDTRQLMPLSQACGRYVDWYRLN